MRLFSTLLGLSAITLAGDLRAAELALTIELLDVDPVSVRVHAANGACVDLGAPLVQAVLTKGKPLVVHSDAPGFCVAQTIAPMTAAGYGAPVYFRHFAGSPPVRVHVRGKMIPGIEPRPRLALPPLVVALDGKEKVGLHLAPVRMKACDLTPSMRWFSGVLEPGKPLTFDADVDCVCYEQTSAPFVDVDWRPPRMHCRKQSCYGKICTTHPSAPYELAVPSRVP